MDAQPTADGLADIRAVIATTAARWLALSALPADLLHRAPAPGQWSAMSCLRHLLDSEEHVWPVRLRAFLAGEDVLDFDPDEMGTPLDPGDAAADLAAEFARFRAANLEALAAVTAADLSRGVRHSLLGAVTLGELLHEWAAHDLMHTVQAEQALMQPFLAGCGPWRPFFAAHDADAGAR